MPNQRYSLTTGHFCLGEGIVKPLRTKRYSGQILPNNNQPNIIIDTFLSSGDRGSAQGSRRTWGQFKYMKIYPGRKINRNKIPNHPLSCTLTQHSHSLPLPESSAVAGSSLGPEHAFHHCPKHTAFHNEFRQVRDLCQGKQKGKLVSTKGKGHKFVPTQTGDQEVCPNFRNLGL